MTRWLLILLVSANVAYFLWAWLRPVPEPSSPAVTGEAFAQAAELDLWSAQEFDGSVVARPAAPESELLCFVAGPFQSEGQRDAIVATMPDAGWQERVLQRISDVTYRVYLGPFPATDVAREVEQELLAAVAERDESLDTFLVTSGERANTLSLGLFREQANALAVQSRVEALGHEVTLEEAASTEDEHWLVLLAGPDHPLYGQLAARLPVANSENLCETFAP